jgi:hypothetical protein
MANASKRGYHSWICAECGRPKSSYIATRCRLCYEAERERKAEISRSRPKRATAAPWTANELAYLRANYATTRADEIAAALGRPYWGVLRRASIEKLPSYQRAGMNSLVQDYFRVIDTPMKAYLLGLLMSDGSISTTDQLKLEVHEKDRCLVELARDAIAPRARIGSHHVRQRSGKITPMVRFAIQSPKLGADLARHGVVNCKTLVVKWPVTVPVGLENSFTCGYYDGDGSLDRRPPYRWATVCGVPEFLVAMQECIAEHTGVRVGGPYRDNRHEHAWSIVTTGRSVLALDAWLHQDIPGLARKRLT